MTTLFVENLTVIDFSYLDPDRGLVGESWLVDLMLSGALNEESMLLDFGCIKKQVKQWIDAQADHRLLVPVDWKHCTLRHEEKQVNLTWEMTSGELITHCSPADAILSLNSERLEPDVLKTFIESGLRESIPENIAQITIQLRPESISGACYHYSHGLKKHAGDCQRIAHGHRSRLEIYGNGTRQPSQESDWAKQWQDIYIGTRSDITEEFEQQGIHYLTFAYSASQGEFSLTLPKHRCYLIDTDSTVECIAEHICAELSRELPDTHWSVKAFEGFGKGAIATRD